MENDINKLPAISLYRKGRTAVAKDIIQSQENQGEFAVACGYSPVYFSLIASGKKRVSDDVFVKIVTMAKKDLATESIKAALYINYGEQMFTEETIKTKIDFLIEMFLKEFKESL